MVPAATLGDKEILPLDILRSQNTVTLIKRRVKKPVLKKQADDTADGIVVRHRNQCRHGHSSPRPNKDKT